MDPAAHSDAAWPHRVETSGIGTNPRSIPAERPKLTGCERSTVLLLALRRTTSAQVCEQVLHDDDF